MCHPVILVSKLVCVQLTADIGDNQAKRDECVRAPEGQADAEGGNDEAAAEAACPTSALLANIPENNPNVLNLLVQNILKDGESKNPIFSFEFLPDMTSAVVTFQSGKGTFHAGNNSFACLTFCCFSSRMYDCVTSFYFCHFFHRGLQFREKMPSKR